MKVKSLSRVWLFVTPWTIAYQAPPSMGFSRQECWSGLPFPSPGDLPDPEIEPGSPTLQADALPSEPPGTILLFSSISLHWSLRKAFLSLHAILWNSPFQWVYLSFPPLPLASLLFSAICKASIDNYVAFLHFFSLGMVLIPASCTMSGTSVRGSSGALSIRSNPLNLLSLPLYNCKGFDLGHTWMV